MTSLFIDSNVLLYLLSADTAKADRAEALVEKGAVISVQVLNEVTAVCRGKFKLPWNEVDALLQAVKAACTVLPLTQETHERAMDLAKQFQFSVYDANIVAAALLGNAKTLYSEDMQHGLRIGSLTIRNPFNA